MTRRVTLHDGREVLLTPTGEQTVRRIADAGAGFIRSDSVHPATRTRLLEQGLIRWYGTGRDTLALTAHGHLVAQLLDQPTPKAPPLSEIRLTVKQRDALAAICGPRPLRESNSTDVSKGVVYWQTAQLLAELGLITIEGPQRLLVPTVDGRLLDQGGSR